MYLGFYYACFVAHLILYKIFQGTIDLFQVAQIAEYPKFAECLNTEFYNYTHHCISLEILHTSLMLFVWQYASSCFCKEQRSSWRWAGWLFSDEEAPTIDLSLFFSNSPKAWSCKNIKSQNMVKQVVAHTPLCSAVLNVAQITLKSLVLVLGNVPTTVLCIHVYLDLQLKSRTTF